MKFGHMDDDAPPNSLIDPTAIPKVKITKG